MDEYGRMGPHKHRRHRIRGKLIAAGIIIVIVLIAGFIYLFGGGPINIGGPTKVTVGSDGTVFAIAGKSYVATLEGYNNNTKTAYVYVSAVPVFLGPLLNITLPQNSIVKINYNSQYAIMQMDLLSGSSGSATIEMAPLAASLEVDPDTQYIAHPTLPLPGLQITVTATSSATTTVGSGNQISSVTTTTKATSTTTATTTILPTNYTAQAISAAVKPDENYGLMINYTDLYNQTANCTPSKYNLSYFDQNGGHFPVPPFDYQNASKETPYGMVQRTVLLVGNKYAVEFLPLSRDTAFNGTVALEINVTVSSPGTSSALGLVTANEYKGIFNRASYSTLSGTYQQSKAITNGCGALVG